MDIHKPKAAHSVREFLIEIGTIICGILIALSLEQGLEWFHWGHKAEEAEHAMRLELSNDDGPQAYARVAITRCLDDKLNAIIRAVEAGSEGKKVVGEADSYEPPLRTWDRQSWEAAVGSDVASHIGADRLNLWSRVFDLTAMLNAQTSRESNGIDLLTGGPGINGRLSQDQADRMIRAAKALRRANFELGGVARLLLIWSKPLEALPSPERRQQILTEARARYGPCVSEPQLDGPRPVSVEYINGRAMAGLAATEEAH